MLAVFGPLLVIELLFAWALLQIVGSGLIWWRLGDIPTIDGLGDAWYYPGVIFFTVGFGEIVPTEVIPRLGAILDALDAAHRIDAQFERWEKWAAGILETHSTVPLLAMFRSHDQRQNWVTALGPLCDAALHAQIIMGAPAGFWSIDSTVRSWSADHDLA